MEGTASGRSLASVVTKIIKVLICTDSRGAGLNELITEARLNALDDNTQIKVKVVIEVRRGAKIEELVKLAEIRRCAGKYDHCIVIGGICNLTVRHREEGKQFLTYTDRGSPQTIKNSIDGCLNTGDNQIFFSTVTPASIIKHYAYYNSNEKPYQEDLVREQQEHLIEDCTELNKYIREKNEEKHLPTLALAGLVYQSTKKRDHRTKKLKTQYRFSDRHLYDGVHLDAELKQRWATVILQFIGKIIKLNRSTADRGEEQTDSQSDDPSQPGTSYPPLQSTDSSESGGENSNFKRRKTNTH